MNTQIRLTILRLLQQAQPYALPQETLFAETNRLLRPAIALGDLVKQLTWLNAQEMVAFLPDELDPENPDARRWLIKEPGLAILKK